LAAREPPKSVAALSGQMRGLLIVSAAAPADPHGYCFHKVADGLKYSRRDGRAPRSTSAVRTDRRRQRANPSIAARCAAKTC